METLSVDTDPIAPPSNSGSSPPINYVIDSGVTRNFGQGELAQTGATFDVALNGDGFFTVQTGAGNRYTRDGRFSVDAQNQLVDKRGDPVLSASGAPITIDPTKPAPAIAHDGSISQVGPHGSVSQLGKIGVVRLADLSQLSKQGDNLYVDNGGQTPQAATNVVMQQGMVEKSNVQPIAEITNMINVTRAYEQVQNMIGSTQDLASKAIDSLGKLAA